MSSEYSELNHSKKGWKNWLGNDHFFVRCFIAFIFFATLAFFLHFREVRVENLELHTNSDRYVIAQVDFEFPDEEATMIIQQQSVRDVGSIHRLSEKQIHQVRFDFESFLLTHQNWRDELPQVTFDEMYHVADLLEKMLVITRFSDARTLQKLHNYYLPTDNYYLILSISVEEPSIFPEEFWNNLRKQLFSLKKHHVETIDFVLNAFEHQPWLLELDDSSQRQLRMIIKEKVPDQYTQIRAGTRLIEPGEKVTSRHLAMLQAMKEAIAKERNPWALRTILGSILLSLLFTLLSILYFRINHREILNSLQKMFLLVTIITLTLVFSKTAEYFLVNQASYLTDIFRYPIIVPFASILIYVLVGGEVALFASAFLTIVLGVTLAIDHDKFLIVNLIASWVAILLARKMHKRKEIFSVLGKVWIACFPVILGFNLTQSFFTFPHLFQDVISSFIFISAIALLIICLLPVLESLFHVMTEMTLMEYMDPNNDLLRRLSLEAPGTYQHSLVVGSIAESAARAIGANGLFCRVATLYHDIGKLFNPHYFTENQLGGFNIHQLLTPLESTQVIVSHVTEGASLARKHRLPQSFIDIILQHHGTSLVYCFYHKQLENMEDSSKVEEKLFRYPGPKPHTKESAIIMLADAIEAASRSLEQLSEDAIADLVEKLIIEKLKENQLDDCQLTFEELQIVKKSLIKTLFVTSHLRVKYPEKKGTEKGASLLIK